MSVCMYVCRIWEHHVLYVVCGSTGGSWRTTFGSSFSASATWVSEIKLISPWPLAPASLCWQMLIQPLLHSESLSQKQTDRRESILLGGYMAKMNCIQRVVLTSAVTSQATLRGSGVESGKR